MEKDQISKITEARRKYRPEKIKYLLIGKASPINEDAYFYFENVPQGDSMFLEVMKVIQPKQTTLYLNSKRDSFKKAYLLKEFKREGFYMMDLCNGPSDTSISRFKEELDELEKNGNIDEATKIIPLFARVYDFLLEQLGDTGMLIKARIFGPGSGQQKFFNAQFRQALEPAGYHFHD